LIEVLVITISNPLLIGIYEDKKLIKVYQNDGMTSDVLPMLFDEILKKYSTDTIYYVNTPGSYMAIKVAYVFLKTISITKNIPLKACSGFQFNENSPIKALGKKYFINENEVVKVDFLENNCKIHDFKLPNVLNDLKFTLETLPIYNLPAV
jgi:tRNA A37 threonylcarbamoyladenosine modification protein TsaB